MPPPSRRSIREQQLAKLLFRELSMIFASAENESLMQLEILGVEPGKSGKHFLVHYGPAIGTDPKTAGFASSAEAGARIAEAGGYIRSELAPALNLKALPDLTYVADPVSWAEWTPS